MFHFSLLSKDLQVWYRTEQTASLITKLLPRFSLEFLHCSCFSHFISFCSTNHLISFGQLITILFIYLFFDPINYHEAWAICVRGAKQRMNLNQRRICMMDPL